MCDFHIQRVFPALFHLHSSLSAGFSKATFLPLLDFAYTSTLTFNFCVMADIANLARHLLMTEVLQICESVHKQVEEQKLMVYQRSEPQVVVTAPSAGREDPEGPVEEPDTYMVTIQDDGRAVVTHGAVTVSAEPLAFVAQSGEGYVQQPVAVVTQAVTGEAVRAGGAGPNTLMAHSGQEEAGETVTLISGCGEGVEGETMTVVTHSGQAGASESLAVVSACLAMEQPHVAEAEPFLITADKESPPEVKPESGETRPRHEVPEVPAAEPAPMPPKRKRGRPAKLKKEVEEPPPQEEQPSADEEGADKQEAASDDPSRRRLRQRSMVEGSYARLHMGLEEEEEGKSTTPPHPSTPKVQNQVLFSFTTMCEQPCL